MRTSASCSASVGVRASAGIETEPQEALTSTPFLRVVSAIAASRVSLSRLSPSPEGTTQNSSPPIR